MNWKSILLGFLVGTIFSIVSFFILSIYLFGDIESKILKAGQKRAGEKFQVLTEPIAVMSVKTPYQVDTISPGTSDLMVLNFWATWCGPCKKEMAGFQELIEKTTPHVKFYFLSDEPLEKQQQAIQRAGWSLPFYKTDSTTVKRFSSLLPTTYIIKRGVVILRQEGEFDWRNPRVSDFLERLQ